jgi:glutamine amidotransferase
MKIVLVDLGLGNVGSHENMLSFLGYRNVVVSSIKDDILDADRLVLPGVGHWTKACEQLDELDLRKAIVHRVTRDKVPILGICLGMQLLFESSEEGTGRGLALIRGSVKRFTEKKDYVYPHMGWNVVDDSMGKSVLLGDKRDETNKFYFVHNYHCVPEGSSVTALYSDYSERFCSIVEEENIYGTQFHPEKSHRYGMNLYKRFLSE